MPNVVIYTTAWCPFCIRAKALLDRKGVAYEEVPVDGNPSLRAEMASKAGRTRSEEHTSELQSLMRISYAVFCLKKKNIKIYTLTTLFNRSQIKTQLFSRHREYT